ncbi:MAG: SAM-dependent methyltransferase [Nitrospirota bacterium]|nr:MAG: SAM-dependent methyltransferase [Nitrospirota bacterium]
MPKNSPDRQGNPELIKKIVLEISQAGPLSFARFMELALYDPSYGYYMTQAVAQDQSSRERIGWQGDFYTAPELSPILAKTFVRQILEIDVQLGRPDPFTFVEMGGGNGTFARDFLQQCQRIAPDFLDRLHYAIVERSPNLQSLQQSCIREAMDNWGEEQLTWVATVEQLGVDSVMGVMFSNELVDAFPVHRVRFHNHHLQEIFIDYVEGKFVERLGPLSSPKLAEYVHRHGVVLKEDQTSELHLAAEQWMAQVAHVLHQGMLVTVDYGHTGSDYYATDRKDGTLVCYHQHTASSNPYTRVGEQDMTAHVNFSALAKAGKECGVLPIGFTTLANWLMGLGVEEMVEGQEQESQDVQALTHLLRPHGMGTTFKVLVQCKGIEPMPLQGLRYRAFFDDVL